MSGRWRRPGEMVQPGGVGPGGPGSGGDSGGAAAAAAGEEEEEEEEEEEAAAAGRVAVEAGSAEGLQRLLEENRELKAALARCSGCLRARCEELRGLRGRLRGERELLRGLWARARALALRLREQRDEATRRLGQRGTRAGDEEVTAADDVPAEPEPPGGAPVPPPDPSLVEQLQQRLAAAETELVAARQAQVAAEQRAAAAAAAAERQLQTLRRQLEQDKASVQAQVTSLLGELRESQNRLEGSRRQREELERRAVAAGQRCRTLEEVTSGHALQLDQLRLQVTNLETALRVERLGATEEKRKLVQLQVAYHHLFQEYDAHIKASLEGDKRGQLEEAQARLQAAEEALAAKQELIDKLKGEAERHRATLETVPVLQAQADIFKADFEAERAAREQLQGQRQALEEALRELQLRLEAQGAARARLEEMRTRHSEPHPAATPMGGFGGPPPEEEPDLCCPKCQYKAPDMDTLQIHVMDCIK